MSAPVHTAPWPVVVTRDEPVDGPLTHALQALGLVVLRWPVLSIGPAAAPDALDAALASLAGYDWVVFASQHAVAAVVQRVPVPPPHVRIGVVGARTAQALEAAGWPVTVVPAEETAAGLVAALNPQLQPGARVLFPAGSRSLPTLRDGLAAAGAAVTQVEAYATGAAPLDVPACQGWVRQRAVGAVTFTSPSAVSELEHALGAATFTALLDCATPISLGVTTGRTLAARGFASVLATPATLSGMAQTTYRLLQTRA